MTSDELVAFLRARLDEDEAAAEGAGGFRWESDSEALKADHGPHGVEQIGELWKVPDDPATGYVSDPESAAHAARRDPARALREVAAMRAIVTRCEQQAGKADENAMEEDRTWILWPVLFELAAIWSGHPDYQEEWMQ